MRQEAGGRRQEPEAGQEQERLAAFYDALTREGGEPVRIGENGRTRKGHAALDELGLGEWCAAGRRPS